MNNDFEVFSCLRSYTQKDIDSYTSMTNSRDVNPSRNPKEHRGERTLALALLFPPPPSPSPPIAFAATLAINLWRKERDGQVNHPGFLKALSVRWFFSCVNARNGFDQKCSNGGGGNKRFRPVNCRRSYKMLPLPGCHCKLVGTVKVRSGT